MEEKEFMAVLGSYKKVRSRESYVERRVQGRSLRGRGSGGGSGGGSGSGGGGDGSADAAASPRGPPSMDFWQGLSRHLEVQHGAAGGKALLQAFDALHYASMREVNYEDVESLCAMLAQELILEVPSPAAKD